MGRTKLPSGKKIKIKYCEECGFMYDPRRKIKKCERCGSRHVVKGLFYPERGLVKRFRWKKNKRY